MNKPSDRPPPIIIPGVSQSGRVTHFDQPATELDSSAKQFFGFNPEHQIVSVGDHFERRPTLTLTDFLVARIDEDEAAGRSALALHGSGTTYPVGHPLDPARILAECNAKRWIVDAGRVCDFDCGDGDCVTAREHWRLLATVYSDHPDYREEWRP